MTPPMRAPTPASSLDIGIIWMWTRFPTREAALGGFVCMRVTDCCVIMITTYVVRTRDCYRLTRDRYDETVSR